MMIGSWNVEETEVLILYLYGQELMSRSELKGSKGYQFFIWHKVSTTSFAFQILHIGINKNGNHSFEYTF